MDPDILHQKHVNAPNWPFVWNKYIFEESELRTDRTDAIHNEQVNALVY